MLSLLIETSTEQGLAAIVQNREILFMGRLPVGYESSKYLIPEIDAGFKQLNISIKDIDFIAVGVGPGSYTGVRIGAMTAKTLAFALEKPLIGLCTLHTFIPQGEGFFAVLIDAKISGVYAIKGNKNLNDITYQCPPQVIDISNLESFLVGCPPLVTPNNIRIKSQLDNAYPHLTFEWQVKHPDPLHMYKLALCKYEQKEYSLEGHIDIMYLRKTQAEIEQEAKKNQFNCNS